MGDGNRFMSFSFHFILLPHRSTLFEADTENRAVRIGTDLYGFVRRRRSRLRRLRTQPYFCIYCAYRVVRSSASSPCISAFHLSSFSRERAKTSLISAARGRQKSVVPHPERLNVLVRGGAARVSHLHHVVVVAHMTVHEEHVQTAVVPEPRILGEIKLILRHGRVRGLAVRPDVPVGESVFALDVQPSVRHCEHDRGPLDRRDLLRTRGDAGQLLRLGAVRELAAGLVETVGRDDLLVITVPELRGRAVVDRHIIETPGRLLIHVEKRHQLIESVVVELEHALIDVNQTVVVGRGILEIPRAELLQVVLAGGGLRVVARLVQRGQEHRREDRDDRDHDEKLDQSEVPTGLLGRENSFHERPLFRIVARVKIHDGIIIAVVT